ncbi:MAG TPA: hypothetical protein VE080_00110 [Candidatus Aquicultoraceae bacterium]|jgi:hypothetical protein|nr:hypothetical protein [Candidatus Aquicultoraceae bacterium]
MISKGIEGTYRLVRRELPDGTVQVPPAVMGMYTYSKGYRHFSVVWKDGEGRYYSECYAARYTLTQKEYSETPEYLIVDDQIEGKEISYDLSGAAAGSPVTFDGGRVRFALPQPFERALSITVEIGGGRLKATGKDLFVDYWERVP